MHKVTAFLPKCRNFEKCSNTDYNRPIISKYDTISKA